MMAVFYDWYVEGGRPGDTDPMLGQCRTSVGRRWSGIGPASDPCLVFILPGRPRQEMNDCSGSFAPLEVFPWATVAE